MNTFSKSYFSYYPLVWMRHSHTNHNKINRLHECYLCIIYSDKISTFEVLLEKDGSVSFHNRNLEPLAIEMYKAGKGLSPAILNELFKKRINISIM